LKDVLKGLSVCFDPKMTFALFSEVPASLYDPRLHAQRVVFVLHTAKPLSPLEMRRNKRGSRLNKSAHIFAEGRQHLKSHPPDAGNVPKPPCVYSYRLW